MFTLMIDPKQGPFPTDEEAKIRERARQIWEDEGRPVGNERMLWDRAKLEIRGDDEGVRLLTQWMEKLGCRELP